jgi:hypothetical protein
MKYLVLIILFWTINITAFSQNTDATIKYGIKKNIFESGKKPIDIKYLSVTKTKDSLFFMTDKFLALGSIAYSDVFLPDSVSSESNTSIKKVITYGGEKYTTLFKTTNKNGITEKVTVTIDNNEILNVSRKKSYHCTNHSPVVHACPTAPGIANPPCNKDCTWELDDQ